MCGEIQFSETTPMMATTGGGADSDEEESSGEPTVMPRTDGPVEETISSGIDLKESSEFEVTEVKMFASPPASK